MRADEADRVRELRLRSLAEDPEAFGSTYARDAAHPDAWWERIAALSDAGEAQRTFVAEQDGVWVGLALVRPGESGAQLNALWVAPEARGRGVARALCEACIAWAAARGFAAISTGVVADNDAARRVYESAGFTPVRVERYCGARSFDELVLTRPL